MSRFAFNNNSNAASNAASHNTASPDITQTSQTEKDQQHAATTQQDQDNQTQVANSEKESIKAGQTRLVTQDRTNRAAQVAIRQSVTKILEKQAIEESQTIDTNCCTPQQRVEELQSKTFASQKSKNDATRALQKLQSRCNHKYNAATRRCEFCNKSRDSHVHD